MSDEVTQLSNPFSTGGGGTNFENQVQSAFVVLMLTGGVVPCLRPWPIKKIKLQGKYEGYNTPPDPNGLWIHRAVADALNGKDAGDMRSGFTMKLFNLRGVHGFSAGKEELKIAEGYHKNADALEEHGYQRFATAMRELAKQYERGAERESQRNPYGDLK